MFFGANMAVKRQALREIQGYTEGLGLKGSDMVGMEDADVIWRLIDRGNWAYVPGAIVHHRNPKERMTEKYIRHWFFGYGRGEATTGQIPPDRLLFGAPRWAWRKAVSGIVFYFLTRPFCKPEKWLSAEAGAAKAWGIICAFRRNPPGKRTSQHPEMGRAVL
jgi:hypothetical protein